MLAIQFALLTSPTSAAPGRDPVQRRAALLFLAHRQHPRSLVLASRAEAELKREGFQIVWHNSFEDLTAKFLKQFHGVVLYYNHHLPKPEEPVQKGLAALREYVRLGGGLLISKDLYTMSSQAAWDALLVPLGAGLVYEGILDPDNVYRQRPPSPPYEFAWTDAILEHPATRGVEGLFYTIKYWEPGEPGTLPLRVDEDWRVLVRGMPTAATFVPNPVSGDHRKPIGPGSIKSSPPLLATRQFGKGRVALWPMLATFTLMDGYSAHLEQGLVMQSMRQGRRSDGARLTYNLLHWLTEPSGQLAGFGGYAPPTAAPATAKKTELGFREIDWSKPTEFGPFLGHAYLGLIGARTGLSTGRGTPDAFIAAARAAGYDFIVFCEDIDEMPKENWDKLVAACERGSGEQFHAFPGMYYRDYAETPFLALGDIGYPKPNWADPANPKKKIRGNAVLRMDCDWKPPVVMLPLKTNKRPARLNSSFYGYAVQVWENEQLVAEDLKTYLHLQKEGMTLFATSVHIVTSPEQVANARDRGMQAWIRADAVADVLDWVNFGGKNRGWYFRPGFASSGPEIQHFHAVNWGTSDLAIPGNDRFRLKLMARSDKGLAEVTLFEQERPARRFLLKGVKELKKTIDEYHSQQRSFVVVARDTDGGTAVSWSRDTNVQEYWYAMCSDNMNDMGPGGKAQIDDGLVALRGTEAKLKLRTPGSRWYWPATPEATAPDGRPLPRVKHPAAMKNCALVSRFGQVTDWDLKYVYLGPGQPGGAYEQPIEPHPYFTTSVRIFDFARRPPGPHLSIAEYQLTLKRDLRFTQSPGIRLVQSHNWGTNDGVLDHVVYPHPSGGMTVVARPTARTGPLLTRLPLSPSHYVGIFPMLTALFALDDGLQAWLYRFPGDGKKAPFSLCSVGVGRKGEMGRAGTVFRQRVAVLSYPFAGQGQYTWLPEYKRYEESNLLAEDLRTKLGLSGSPAYRVEPTVGTVEDTRLVLRLAAEGYGFRGKFRGTHLPVPLPVFISGLNPRWSAGVWYKGRNQLLQTEWPPGYHQKAPEHRRYVQLRTKTDEIIRFGFFDNQTGVGYLQLDLEAGDRDIFIGNLITCDRADLFLTFHRDRRTKRASVDVHNPTDAAAKTVLKPAGGFDLLGSFSRTLDVPPGSTVSLALD